MDGMQKNDEDSHPQWSSTISKKMVFFLFLSPSCIKFLKFNKKKNILITMIIAFVLFCI